MAVLAAFLFACLPAAAADMVGVVDPQKLLFQHPQFDSVAKHILDVSRQKGNEVRFALEKETDPEKKADILKAANLEMVEAEERLMSPIHKDCRDALAAVMKKKNITIVLKIDAAYFGGTDITEEVIAQMKANAKN